MATEVKAILQRIEAKDYRDIAAMVKAGVSLPKRYGHAFQPSESLRRWCTSRTATCISSLRTRRKR